MLEVLFLTEFIKRKQGTDTGSYAECSKCDSCGGGKCGSCTDDDEKSLTALEITKIAVGIAFFAAAFIIKYVGFDARISFALYAAAYIILGSDIVIAAFKNTIHGQLFDENFLMTVASIGAFVTGEYPEAVGVMLFYRIGEELQDAAIGKSRRQISSLLDIRPDYANVIRGGNSVRVDPAEVHPDDMIIVKNGEKVPLDGIISEGSAYLDTSVITGESVPRLTGVGDTVLSGSINNGSPITVKVTNDYENSTVSRILELTENARERKAPSEKFITEFSKIYTPVVIALAVLVALIPSLITGDAHTWINRGLMFLVISCPCALVISVPLGFFAGIGKCSKNGILVKGGNYLELLSKVSTIIFDKTGTLTKGVFEVNNIVPVRGNAEDLLRTAAYAEVYSNHPAAAAVTRKYNADIDRDLIGDYAEIAGMGICATVNGHKVLAGNEKLMTENKISFTPADDMGTIIYVSSDGLCLGYIAVSDREKDDSKDAVAALGKKHIRTVMLTGDKAENAAEMSARLGISETHAELLPADKVDIAANISKNNNGTTAFVGDGINDAPVLAAADIGIAMGGLGSDSAVEAADIVLMTDEPAKIVSAIGIAKRTMVIVKENIIFALSVKLIIMILGVLGLCGMWLAIFADVGVALIAILNSTRALMGKTN